MSFLIGLVAILGGVLNTVQSGANATLGKTIDSPVLTAFVVVGCNLVVYLLAAAVMGLNWPPASRLAQVPWWAWIGGFLGAFYVLSVIFLAQKLGAAVFTGLTVTAGIVTSVLLDHFGLVGFQQHGAGLWRILGCLMMIGGLALVSAF